MGRKDMTEARIMEYENIPRHLENLTCKEYKEVTVIKGVTCIRIPK